MSAIRRVWVTRAEPGASRTAERLTALGFDPVKEPLLSVRRLSPVLELSGVVALAFTSVNGVEAFAALCPARDVSVFTVGDATAEAARAAGFRDVRSASGDVGALAGLIRSDLPSGPVLHPAAREPARDLAHLLAPDVGLRSVAVYEVIETETPSPGDFDAVLIHSPRAGRALAALHADAGTAGRIAVAISAAAAAPLAGLGLKQIRIAETPTEHAMIAALGKPGASL